MNRMLDFAVTATTVGMVAYAGAVVPLPLKSMTLKLAHAGGPAAGVAPRRPIGEANRTGPTIDDVVAQSCLTTGASAAPPYLCAPGSNALHTSRSPIRERTAYAIMKPVSIFPLH